MAQRDARLAAALDQPKSTSHLLAAVKTSPQINIAVVAEADELTLLLTRLVVRQPSTRLSAPVAKIAAGVPYNASSAKVKISATPSEYFVRGIRTGKHPASAMKPMPTSTLTASDPGRART
jgi:hypothetical protein